MTLPIRISEALLGATRSIESLDGQEPLSIPAGSSDGDVLRIRGRGVPYGRGNRGDLLIRVSLEIPKKLSKKAQQLVQDLRSEGL